MQIPAESSRPHRSAPRPRRHTAEPRSFRLTIEGCAYPDDALLSGAAHRHAAGETAAHLFARHEQLRALLDEGFEPVIDRTELSYFDPSGRFDRLCSELRLNRLGRGPIRLHTSFFRSGRLVARASLSGCLQHAGGNPEPSRDESD